MLIAYFSYSNTEKSNQKMQLCLIQLSANNEQLQQPQWINTVDTAKFMPAITAGINMVSHETMFTGDVFCLFHVFTSGLFENCLK